MPLTTGEYRRVIRALSLTGNPKCGSHAASKTNRDTKTGSYSAPRISMAATCLPAIVTLTSSSHTELENPVGEVKGRDAIELPTRVWPRPCGLGNRQSAA
jgi:hypothetical protein